MDERFIQAGAKVEEPFGKMEERMKSAEVETQKVMKEAKDIMDRLSVRGSELDKRHSEAGQAIHGMDQKYSRPVPQ